MRQTESAMARRARRTREADRRSEAERKLLAEQRKQFAATKANFLRSQGPPVTKVILDDIQLIFLVRRLDLLALARQSAVDIPQPITAMVRRLVMARGQPSDDMVSDEHIEELMGACALIARAAVIVPPAEWLSGEIDEADITVEMCKPLFAEEDPDEDQVVLRVIGQDEADAMSDDDRRDAAGSGFLSPSDLMFMAASIYKAGPGGLGGGFRVS